MTSPKLIAYDRAGKPVELTLYKFDSCPYCQRVQRVIDELHVPMRYRDTLLDADARDELIRAGGRSQVPCLFINGKPLYESGDIVRYLRSEIELRPI